jgi:hypothetical protein
MIKKKLGFCELISIHPILEIQIDGRAVSKQHLRGCGLSALPRAKNGYSRGTAQDPAQFYFNIPLNISMHIDNFLL